MEHVTIHHRNGERLARTGRLDLELYRHFWHSGAIDEYDYKLITSGCADSAIAASDTKSKAYTETNRRSFQRKNRKKIVGMTIYREPLLEGAKT